MAQLKETLKLTTAQAIIRDLKAQYFEADIEEKRVCGLGIFSHVNMICLSELSAILSGYFAQASAKRCLNV